MTTMRRRPGEAASLADLEEELRAFADEVPVTQERLPASERQIVELADLMWRNRCRLAWAKVYRPFNRSAGLCEADARSLILRLTRRASSFR
jgi:hypothetical protein